MPPTDVYDRLSHEERTSIQFPLARHISYVKVEDLRNKTESLYHASRTRPGENLPTKSALIKGASYLRKAFDKPSLEESLPLVFVHKKHEDIRPRMIVKDATAPAPRYVVERKDNSSQVASRMAYLINHFKGGGTSGPQVLCYCLKSSYARSIAGQLGKHGIKAKVHVAGDDEKLMFRQLSCGDLDVVCVGADGKLCLIVHLNSMKMQWVSFLFYLLATC